MEVDPTLVPHLHLRAFAEELANCGVEVVATSPGSRNTPLLLALNGEPRLRCYSLIDERAAAFFALGAAKASGKAAVAVCTSGTAAANFYPAAVEADQAGVPLLLLTADRPAELRECGAGQTIDQLKLFGSAVRFFFELELTPDLSGLGYVRELACRAYALAAKYKPGPVQINFPLRDPLVYDRPLPQPPGGRGGKPQLRFCRPQGGAALPADLCHAFADARRPLIVAGRLEGSPTYQRRQGEGVAAFAAALGIPLFADPLSWARRPPTAISHYDALLRVEPLAQRLIPDLVLRVGALPTSKPLRRWLAVVGGRQMAIHPHGEVHDPDRVVELVVEADPAAVLSPFQCGGGADPSWLGELKELDQAASRCLRELVGNGFSELAAVDSLWNLLPAEATVLVSSSMPVRDAELLWQARDRPPRVLANRGANGIDGTVATALGVCAACPGEKVVALIGDVALAHDLSGLAAAGRLGLDLTVVLIDNGGGAIFDLLPVAHSGEAAAIYEQQVATPTEIQTAALAQAVGFNYLEAASGEELRAALEGALAGRGPTLIRLSFPRANAVGLRREVAHRLQRALEAVGAADRQGTA